MSGIQTPLYSLQGGKSGWIYRLKDGRSFLISYPLFEIDGRDCELKPSAWWEVGDPRKLRNGVEERLLEATMPGGLILTALLRTASDSPIFRLQYTLSSLHPRALTKKKGRDRLRYLGLQLPNGWAQEVRLSEWLPSVHSFCLQELPVEAWQSSVFGPILAAGDKTHSLLAAYEHGSTVPDDYLHFDLTPGRKAELVAVKGNYLRGQALGQADDYTTVWMQFGAIKGGYDDLARGYRHFALHRFCENKETRKPYVCSNTWNYQERRTQAGFHFNGQMNSKRMLKEAAAAAKLGVDVFVVDTGWFVGSGDWKINPKRFPQGMKPLHKALKAKGMKLGLWFSPEWAALESEAFKTHQDCVTTQGGKRDKPWANWDSQPALKMCFASRYWEAFADRLIELHHETGCVNFKWDAVGQYGCDDPNHFHGDKTHSAKERAEAYSFQLPLRLVQVVERLQEAFPDAVVDFDITETKRAVGLAWLSVSRYFLFNNGPYYQDFDHEVPKGKTWNLFFNPGPARSWISRAPLGYDRWLPSTCLMWHQLPDDPKESEDANLATLALGPGGLWGDFPAIKPTKAARIGAYLRRYKKVGAAMAEASPIRRGRVGGSPEVHEKISGGRGAVMFFASEPGTYEYATQSKVAAKAWLTPGLKLKRLGQGRALLSAEFKPGEYAKTAFFGA